MKPFLLFLPFCVGTALISQTVPLSRTPAPQALPNLEDITAGVQALEQAEQAPPGVGGLPAGLGKSAGPIPKDFKPRTDLPLSPTAAAAVLASQQWGSQSNIPAAGPDGRVLYSFGAGMPTVVCAPLRVCIVEMEPGEKIVGEPHIGDAVRWNVAPALYGEGSQATALIVLKPQSPGLDTNMLITTDRRAYYLRLISKPADYVARIAFAYPDDDQHRWQQHLLEQRATTEQSRAEVLPAMITAEKMRFDYRITGGNEHIRPLRVFDDGAKTYLQMPPAMEHMEAPVLLVIGTDGKGTMTNYRVQQQTYIVDRLFDRARLVLGNGKKAQKVEISRAGKG
jgi:type IV secretion system protein VirB9